MNTEAYLFVGAMLFVIGIVGFLTRRNLIIIFLCTELMFQGVALTLVAFSRQGGNLAGQAFTLFVLVAAAAEAALALGLIVYLYRRRPSLDVDIWSMLKG